ncbi:MAG: DEAD/DEAH box helicase [Acidobacteriia bacterium]|nr:DEAD/DEAH box helicase [Terriglobia bacterium]
MKLASALSSDFDSDVRSRGVSYYRSGAVRIVRGSPSEVEASVRGSRTYDVDITWDGHVLTLFCDCPYFEGGGPCKHLWATILASDAKDHLGAMTRFDPHAVYYDAPDETLDEDEALEEEDPDQEPAYYERPTRHFLPIPSPAVKPQPQVLPPAWRQRIQEIAREKLPAGQNWPASRELLYLVDVAASINREALVVSLSTREPKRNGGWKKPAAPNLTRGGIAGLPNPVDRQILDLLSGCINPYDWSASPYQSIPTAYRLLDTFASIAMPLIASSGRCMLLPVNPAGEEMPPLVWDEGEPWRFHLCLIRHEAGNCAITGWLRRGEEEMDLSTPALVTPGLVFTRDRIARLEESAPFEWVASLRRLRRIDAPEDELEPLLVVLMEHPLAVRLEVPEDLRYEEVNVAPRPCLTVRAARKYEWEQERMRAELSFDYDGRRVPEALKGRGMYDASARRFLVRDKAAEDAAKTFLRQLGLDDLPANWQEDVPALRLAPKRLPAVARACLEAGWHIEAEGKIFKRPGAMQVRVSSGVDWFDLYGEVDYGGTTANLPVLLAALRRGENMVRLDDGTYGLLPEEWLSRFGSFAGLGASETDHLRFRRNQAGLLDALLAAQPEVNCDETFARVRDELRCFAGIGAGEQPEGFEGQLRDYQREGIGWMEFLRRFGFGGCLADDMGVGKTAQVLALLETRRALRASSNGNGAGKDGPCGPSLVVVPKSLVFNWKQEAARFTPRLRVLDHTGLSRDVAGFAPYDVILTTYGTLRRDAAEFKDLEFDYIVLDEAQAIKNANTESAKAARLLRGRHRLALSGTPVENHLGELWSIFEFLNPGMLGAASVLKLAGGAGRNPSEETRRLLAHALRPFILRRTKQQVARELPLKSEQTILCELEAPQRKLYNELRAHYRNSLLNTVAAQGLAKSKIQVLEALLRLRQAACHPGLLDPKRRNDSSAKLDVLIGRLGEVVEEGHKALVFSQFTSLLAIVRERLDELGIVYEYLDGATRDRQQRVDRFQNDSTCGLFLISLKAGGLGLNLTAAEYVFLLDPWWNPAVEAQAVDRAHRIGQTRQVFAYRLIARDTVEEKVLQLQNSKRELAAAIISEDNSLIRNLQREDLELLLS